MDYATDYDVGDRKRAGGINEDSVAVTVFEQGHREGLETAGGNAGEEASDNRSAAVVALADGAGGHDAGDVASYIASTVICEELAETVIGATRADSEAFGVDVPKSLRPAPLDEESLQAAVESAIVEAHREILRYTQEAGAVAHTTVVAGVWLGGQFHYGWVGDSRAYLVNGEAGRIERLTKDHAVVEELHDSGAIDDIEAQVHPRGNEITRAIGGAPQGDVETASVPVETRSVPVYAEDVLLVTSDGLIDAQDDAPQLYDDYVDSGRDEATGERVWEAVVTDDELRECVLAGDELESVAADFVEMANDRGGKDNISIVLARDQALSPTPAGLRTRAIDPNDVADRETVILPDEG